MADLQGFLRQEEGLTLKVELKFNIQSQIRLLL